MQGWVAAAGAVAVAAGVWFGVVGSDDSSVGGTEGPSPATVNVRDALDLVPGCRIDTCTVLDRRGGFRLDGAAGTLAVVGGPGTCDGLPEASIHLLGRDGVLWSSPASPFCGDPRAGIESDRTGHAFLAFPGGPAGARLLVLRFGEGEVEDFGSLDGRFVGEAVAARDLDDDGVFEIVVGAEVVYRWTGEGYSET